MHLHTMSALLDICIHFVEANSDIVDVVSKQQQLPSLNTRTRMGLSVTSIGLSISFMVATSIGGFKMSDGKTTTFYSCVITFVPHASEAAF